MSENREKSQEMVTEEDAGALEQQPGETGSTSFGSKGMAKEDKIALTLIAGFTALLFITLLAVIRYVLGMFGYVVATASDGVGFKSAFISSIGISFFMMLVFALCGGDGVVGELGVMLIGFFVMVIFFTISIAIIL
jgi:hypothetical protein